jgi:hypothetical protein
MLRAAKGGLGEAMFKVARSHLGRGEMDEAAMWLRRAIVAGDHDAAYQMAILFMGKFIEPEPEEDYGDMSVNALAMFQLAAKGGSSAFGGASFGMYNIGIAHLYGFARLPRNPDKAATWFEASGLPEGMMALKLHRSNMGLEAEADEWDAKSRRAGFDTVERSAGRDKVGFALHHKWAEVRGQKGPPAW